MHIGEHKSGHKGGHGRKGGPNPNNAAAYQGAGVLNTNAHAHKKINKAEAEQFFLEEFMKEREGKAMRALFKEMRRNLIEDNEKLRKKRRKSREIDPAIEVIRHIKRNFKPENRKHTGDKDRKSKRSGKSTTAGALIVPAVLLLGSAIAYNLYVSNVAPEITTA